MILYPAIDLKGGKVVRLEQGRADAETVYEEDASIPAGKFKEAGAEWIHVVDLDGAFTQGSASLFTGLKYLAPSGAESKSGSLKICYTQFNEFSKNVRVRFIHLKCYKISINLNQSNVCL